MRNRLLPILAIFAVAIAQTGCITAVGVFQPEDMGGETIVITTTNSDGTSRDRVVSPIDDGGTLVVAANHWPRQWYRNALANPDVTVKRGDTTSAYRAVPVSAEEKERLLDEHGFPPLFGIFTGFAPREFLKLEPQ